MKRNKELIKKILLFFENADWPNGNYNVNIDGYDENVIKFHVEILVEARFLYRYKQDPVAFAIDRASSDFPPIARKYPAERLTWIGFEFLDNAKNETFWNSAMKTAGLFSFAIALLKR